MAGECFGKALDMSLEVMRKTPHTRLRKSVIELHHGGNSNTEISNLLKLGMLETLTKGSVFTGVLFQWSWPCVRPATFEAEEMRERS